MKEGEKKRQRTQLYGSKGELLIDLNGEFGTLKFNPDQYHFKPNQFHHLPDYIYELFAVTYTQSFRRICVSLTFGFVCYLIGLIIAFCIGFATTYATTLVPYLLPLLTVIVIDQLRWAKGPFANHLNETREALIIDDDQYLVEINTLIRKINDKRPVFFIFFITLIIWIIVLIVKYFAPTSTLGRYISILIPKTMPASWFTGPNLLVKMIIAMWILFIPLLHFAYSVYVPATLVSQWRRIVLKWPVVPIPSFISTVFGEFIIFYLHALVSYAIGVLAIVVAYGGKFEPPLIIIASLLSILGIFCMFFPLYTIYQLVNRARAQVGHVVLNRYFHYVYPIAGGTARVRNNTTREESVDAYLELNKLQELMNNANEGSNHVYRLNLILPAILSQAIPFLGFLYPLIFIR